MSRKSSLGQITEKANENPHAFPSQTPQIQTSCSVSQLLVHQSREIIWLEQLQRRWWPQMIAPSSKLTRETLGSESAPQPLAWSLRPLHPHSIPSCGRRAVGLWTCPAPCHPPWSRAEPLQALGRGGHSRDGRECFGFWSFWDELWGGSCLLSEELVKFLVRCAIPLKMHYLFSKLKYGCWLRVFKILL